VYYNEISTVPPELMRQFIIDTVAYIKNENIYITKVNDSKGYSIVNAIDINPNVLNFIDEIMYNAAIYLPYNVSDGYPVNDGVFNLFTGLAVWDLDESTYEPNTANVIRYVKHVFCRGNESTYAYFIGWLAHIIQAPNEPNSTFIHIKSKHPDIFWDWFCTKLLGEHNCIQNNPNKLLHIAKSNYEEVKAFVPNGKCSYILHSDYTYGPTPNMFQLIPETNLNEIKFLIDSFDDDTTIDFHKYLCNYDLTLWDPIKIPDVQGDKSPIQLFIDDIRSGEYEVETYNDKIFVDELRLHYVQWCNCTGHANDLSKREFKQQVEIYTNQKAKKATMNNRCKNAFKFTVDCQIRKAKQKKDPELKQYTERESLIHKQAKNTLKVWLDEGLTDYQIDETVVEYPIIETKEWNSLEINQWPLSGPPSFEYCKNLNRIPIAIIDVVSFKNSIPTYGFEICHTNPVSETKTQKINQLIQKVKSNFKLIEIDASWINQQSQKPKTLNIKRTII
jgi:hypothetical protein